MILISRNFSCAPVWADPEGMSYIIYLLVVGWAIPNIVLVGSSIEVIRYQKQVLLWLFYFGNFEYFRISKNHFTMI